MRKHHPPWVSIILTLGTGITLWAKIPGAVDTSGRMEISVLVALCAGFLSMMTTRGRW